MKGPAQFGSSAGPLKPIGESSFDLSLHFAAMKSSIGSSELEDFEFTFISALRTTKGGLAAEYAITQLGVATSASDIYRVAPYGKKDGTLRLVRIQSTTLDRWNGAAWLTIPGARGPAFGLTGYYSTIAEDKFVYANGVNRLTSWDGVDANAQVDLSVDAPIAKYVTRIGNRLFAANIKVGGIFDPYLAAWSADGNIGDWTTALAGAGSVRPPIEGSDETPQLIMGLSTINRGVLIFRQNALQLASLTGIGAAPFRFSTIAFAQGTESPYTIASGSMLEGVFYLGIDHMVYFFDGQTVKPIGDPIRDQLQAEVSNQPFNMFATIDHREQEYVLGGVSGPWGFNIREFATTGKLKWRKPNPAVSGAHRSFGYGYTGVVPSPAFLVGDNTGNVFATGTALRSGQVVTKTFTFQGNEVTISRVRIFYRATIPGVIRITAKNENGQTSVTTDINTVAQITTQDNEVLGELNLTGRSISFVITLLSGDTTIVKMVFKIQNRGLTNA